MNTDASLRLCATFVARAGMILAIPTVGAFIGSHIYHHASPPLLSSLHVTRDLEDLLYPKQALHRSDQNNTRNTILFSFYSQLVLNTPFHILDISQSQVYLYGLQM